MLTPNRQLPANDIVNGSFIPVSLTLRSCSPSVADVPVRQHVSEIGEPWLRTLRCNALVLILSSIVTLDTGASRVVSLST